MKPNHVTLIGASGRRYDYNFVAEGDPRRSEPGNFAVVAMHADTLVKVVLVGQSQNLPWVASSVLPAETIKYGATHALFRVNEDAADREAEVGDIVRAYNPEANKA